MNTTKKLIVAFTAIQQLASVTRYSKDTIINKESVLEHTGFVAVFSYLLAKQLKQDVDIGKLLSRAVVHDLDEIFTGDIPRITKYSSADILKAFKQVEETSIGKLSYVLGVELLDTWQESKANDLEGLLMRITDMVAVVYKCWQEIELFGNYSIVRIVFELRKQVIPKVRTYVRESNHTDDNTFAVLTGLLDACNEIMYKLEMSCQRVSSEARDALVTFNVAGDKSV